MAGPSCDTSTTIYTLPDLLLSCQRRASEGLARSRFRSVASATTAAVPARDVVMAWGVATH